jgi:hypothetical protein
MLVTGQNGVELIHRITRPGDAMAEKWQMVVYAAAFETVEAALAELDASRPVAS